MASKSSHSEGSTESFSATSRRSIVLTPDELEIWELYYYAGLTVDPQVFRAIFDLIRMDIHPKAVMDVLESIVKQSKYNTSPKETKTVESKSDSSIQQVSSRRPKSPLPSSTAQSKNLKNLRPSSDGTKSDGSHSSRRSQMSRVSEKTTRT